MIRKVTHFLLAWIGTVFWAIGNCLYVLTALIILLGQKVHPTSKYGNCWSYAVPLWLRYGGHLAVRASDHNKFLWVFPLPHVKFIPVLPPEGVEMRQFIPPESERQESEAFPWYAVYYKVEIHDSETPHNAMPGWEKDAGVVHDPAKKP